jgi:Raf kinase inhibitor-like YbhB/YbcL family protein
MISMPCLRLALLLTLVSLAGWVSIAQSPALAGASMALKILAFADGGRIPKRFTCAGADVSPALSWSGVPAETRSFVLLMDDPDAPGGTWRHWAVYDIPSDIHELAQAMPKKAQVGTLKQGMNDFQRVGYGGPCPPPGHGPHRYRFRLLALDAPTLGFSAEAAYDQVAAAARGHVTAEARRTGVYSR